MLDFSKLKTPPGHGEVLVVPEPAGMAEAARANNAALGAADVPLLDSTLSACRRQTRETIAGGDDVLVVVTGHGPTFIHPGVWAKHIVAARLAEAVDGIGLNLVVDSDTPKGTTLSVPSVVRGGVVVRSVPFTRSTAGFAYEQIQPQTLEEMAWFERGVHEALGERYADSQMPRFFSGLRVAAEARDWVDQTVAARRAIETSLGVAIEDRRVGCMWHGPLLLDVFLQAERFAASYNRALASYRRDHRVRGAQRPIPDLHCDDGCCEVPVWVYRAEEPRRRLFVARAGDALRFFAGSAPIGEVPSRGLDSCGSVNDVLDALSGWRLRPRALTLTIWARLMLADLFVHGIGGAKYDRISDGIIADYYGVTPPMMACVSATLHMDLPQTSVTAEAVREARHVLRDIECNPQRRVPMGADIDPLIRQRRDAVQWANELAQREPRRHAARRTAFDQIRGLNVAILAQRRDTLDARRAELERVRHEFLQNRIAQGREYFFGLYARNGLEELLAALPPTGDFRV
jgi:hypothetical protein